MVLTREYISGIIKEMGGTQLKLNTYATQWRIGNVMWNVAEEGCGVFSLNGVNLRFHIHYSSKWPVRLSIL